MSTWQAGTDCDCRHDAADEILSVMKRAGYDVREVDPFGPERVLGALGREQAPIVGRLQSLWKTMRTSVIAVFPEAPLSFVDDIYRNEAYHSLSIKGYRNDAVFLRGSRHVPPHLGGGSRRHASPVRSA